MIGDSHVRGSGRDTSNAARASERVEAFDKSDCTNGPDESGHYPCDPKAIFGGGFAECQVCGRVAPWDEEDTL